MHRLVFLAQPLAGGATATGGYGWALIKMFLALLLVCALAIWGLRFLRRHMPASAIGSRFVRVIDRCPLTARQNLWLVQAGQRVFLLGSTEQQITSVAELDGPSASAILTESGKPGGSFWEILQSKKKNNPPGSEGPLT